MNVINRIIRWFRKKYLVLKYKRNWNTGKVIMLKEKDRAYGLTTMMLNDCVTRSFMLFVPNEIDKRRLVNEICEMGKIGNIQTITECEACRYILSRDDVIRYGHYGRNIHRVIVDNHCTYKDIETLKDSNLYIANGFITDKWICC